jgi:hypothetical protein
MVEQLEAPNVTPDPEATNGHTAPADEAAPDDRQARWMEQLQAMIDNVASTAGPAMRELAAKAAELAAKAGDAAGPFAHRAASVTSDVGQRVAARGREIATDLRRAAEGSADDVADAAETGADAVMPDPTTDAAETHPGA